MRSRDLSRAQVPDRNDTSFEMSECKADSVLEEKEVRPESFWGKIKQHRWQNCVVRRFSGKNPARTELFKPFCAVLKHFRACKNQGIE